MLNVSSLTPVFKMTSEPIVALINVNAVQIKTYLHNTSFYVNKCGSVLAQITSVSVSLLLEKYCTSITTTVVTRKVTVLHK